MKKISLTQFVSVSTCFIFIFIDSKHIVIYFEILLLLRLPQDMIPYHPVELKILSLSWWVAHWMSRSDHRDFIGNVFVVVSYHHNNKAGQHKIQNYFIPKMV